MKKVVVNASVISYEDVGSGPVVVVLHGWGTQAANMSPVINELKGRFRVIAPDFPGFGSSEQPSTAWSVGEYADFVVEFLEKLKINDVYALVGHSFGGRITLVLAGRGKLAPQKIVLLDSAGVRHSDSARNKLYGVVAKAGKVAVRLLGLKRYGDSLRRRLYKKAGSDDYLQAGTMRDIFVKAIREDLVADAKNIAVPALLIWGENDHDTPVSDARILQSAIKNSTLVVAPQAGHFVYADAPDLTLGEVRKFL